MKNVMWIFFLLPIATILYWYVATPWVSVHYSEEGKIPLKIFMFTPNDKYSDAIPPGEARGSPGQFFQEDDYFMQIEWRAHKVSKCVNIKPKWRTTHIYIDADGEINKSAEGGTDVDRLKECPNE